MKGSHYNFRQKRLSWSFLAFVVLILHPVFYSLLNAETPAPSDLKDLYLQIDDALDHSAEYINSHRELIEESHSAFVQARSDEYRMMYAEQLFMLYRSFENDSALVYIQHYIEIAERLGNTDAADRGRSLMAYQCSTSGMYSESLAILDGLNSSHMSQDVLTDYLNARVHVYNELAYYTPISGFRDHYYSLRDVYRDSLYAIADKTNPIYLQIRESQLLDEHHFEEAISMNDIWMSTVKPESRDWAIVCYYRYLIYAVLQDPEQSRYWLAQSALSDIRHAVMDQASLISLAQLLNQDGDFERSYRYIGFTWRSNDSFNTRMRSWQISPILTIIEKDYQTQKERSAHILLWLVVSVSLLAMIAIGALLFSLRERRRLADARSELQESNSQLKSLNSRLASQTDELSELNNRLSLVNTQLAEANWVKEEYIGRFLSLCSNYVDKMDDYRKMVNRKLKNREFDELAGITKSTEFKDKELEELYENFDKVFLHLFPNFISEFNSLLQPEFQIQIKQPGRLNIDLRIFALIRLGIEDSSRIAEFLHYSVNTIYSYRARIKNGAAGNRDEFENEVKKLGHPM